MLSFYTFFSTKKLLYFCGRNLTALYEKPTHFLCPLFPCLAYTGERVCVPTLASCLPKNKGREAQA